MTRGSIEWVVRSLRDWANSVGQGMALVTYRSESARARVIGDLTELFVGSARKVGTLTCANWAGQEFVERIIQAEGDVLSVLDPDRVLFGNDEKAPFWVNFQRENIVGRSGVQIWWMMPIAALRFGRELPDLARFFLFREDLADEAVAPGALPDGLEIRGKPIVPGDADRGRDLLARALQATRSGAAPERIWLELGIPAIDAFLGAGEIEAAADALTQISAKVGSPDVVLKPAMAIPNAKLGWTFLTLGTLNSKLGQLEEALAETEEAVGMFRRLAEDRPEEFLPDLGRSLSNLANRLSDVGRPEEALVPAEDAVCIYRELAQQKPDAYLPDLGMSVNNLAAVLSRLEHREEPLAMAEECVSIYRRLVQQSHGLFLGELARSLSNLANVLSRLGRDEEALPMAEEAVRHTRQLVQVRGDGFLPDLGISANNMAVTLSGLGRREDALAPAEEAVRVYRELAEQRPEAFLPDLSRALVARGAALGEEHGREAMGSFAEAVRLLMPLCLKLPNVYLPLMRGIVRDYLQAVQWAKDVPDETLLAPLRPLLDNYPS